MQIFNLLGFIHPCPVLWHRVSKRHLKCPQPNNFWTPSFLLSLHWGLVIAAHQVKGFLCLALTIYVKEVGVKQLLDCHWIPTEPRTQKDYILGDRSLPIVQGMNTFLAQ